jgi:DNA polymerase I-like protein with 3'-5' exonuclease and polymerase domains
MADPAGAIERVDPRVPRNAAEMAELETWLEERGDQIALGWSIGQGRPLERQLYGIAVAGVDGTSWYVPCDPDSIAVERLPAWFARDDRLRVGHDLKQLVTTLAADRQLELKGTFWDTLVAGYMVNPALRSQTIDDLAATRFGASLPDRPLTPETGAEEQQQARRAAVSTREWPVISVEGSRRRVATSRRSRWTRS